MAIVARWRVLILLLFAALLAACAAPPQPATSTYTFLPTPTRTALPSATATPLPPTETRQPAPLPRPSATVRPTTSPTASLAPWTPQPYTPPAAHPLALSPENAGQMQELAVLGYGSPADVAWSPDGKLLAVAAYDWVDLYDTTSWERVAHYPLAANLVAFNPANGLLVAVEGDTIQWLDIATGTIVREQPSAAKAIRRILISPGGLWLAVLGVDHPGGGDPNYVLEVVNATTGERLFTRTELTVRPFRGRV